MQAIGHYALVPRVPAAAAVLAAMLSFLAGCSSGGDNGTSTTTTTCPSAPGFLCLYSDSTVPTYGKARATSTETWIVPVSRLRKLGKADPRVAILQNTLDHLATNAVLIKVERYSEPVDYSNRISLRPNSDALVARADTFITISDPNGGRAAWQPADYAKVKDLLALLPTLGSKKSSATP